LADSVDRFSHARATRVPTTFRGSLARHVAYASANTARAIHAVDVDADLRCRSAVLALLVDGEALATERADGRAGRVMPSARRSARLGSL
jgi:hypothetical protein